MFAGKPADYFYMLAFNWLCSVLIGFLVGLPVSNLIECIVLDKETNKKGETFLKEFLL